VTLRKLTVAANAFTDDSTPDSAEDATGLVVDAVIDDSVDISWLSDLRQRVSPGRPVKFKDFKRVLHSGEHGDLRHGVLRGIQRASIVIADPEVCRSELFRDCVMPLIGQRPYWALSAPIRRWLDCIEGQVQRRVLSWSPMVDAATLMTVQTEEDIARRLRLLPQQWTPEPSAEELDQGMQDLESGVWTPKKTNIGMFSARSTVALFEWLDPEVHRTVADEFDTVQSDLIYAPRNEHIHTGVARHALATRHTFDNGNTLSIEQMNHLRGGLARTVRGLRRLWSLGEEDISAPDISELADEHSPFIQVADIASGYARMLYEPRDSDALQKVKDFFRCVVYNGDLLHRHR
jgi:hypothetical protein